MQLITHELNEFAKFIAFIPDGQIGYQNYRQRPGIILAPGGAYLNHAIRENEGVALEFMQKGFNVYSLEYTIGFMSREERESKLDHITTKKRFPQPVYELLETIHIIRSMADDFNQDVDRLFLMGFSAGGHLCASAGILWDDPDIIKHLPFEPVGDELKATGMVLCYPMLTGDPAQLVPNEPDVMDRKLMSQFLFDTETPTAAQIAKTDLTTQIKETTIPTFIWHSIDDDVVNAMNSTRFFYELQKRGINCELHMFDHGGHALALCNQIYARTEAEYAPEIGVWVDLADHWMKRK